MKLTRVLTIAMSLLFIPQAWPQGKIVSFDPPGSLATFPQQITPAGTIVGYYFDSNIGSPHGFVRSATGAITTFDVIGADSSIARETVAFGINPSGDITGYFFDSNGLAHGFLRTPKDAFTTFDVPGAGSAPIWSAMPMS